MARYAGGLGRFIPSVWDETRAGQKKKAQAKGRAKKNMDEESGVFRSALGGGDGGCWRIVPSGGLACQDCESGFWGGAIPLGTCGDDQGRGFGVAGQRGNRSQFEFADEWIACYMWLPWLRGLFDGCVRPGFCRNSGTGGRKVPRDQPGNIQFLTPQSYPKKQKPTWRVRFIVQKQQRKTGTLFDPSWALVTDH